LGTNCIHLPETHEVVKLFRDVLGLVAPNVLLLTETNVPNEENISYFGAGDEAHMVYQFSLPPLLLHALHTCNAQYLTDWANSLPLLQPGSTFLNFTASHDGVGVRPLEGLVPDEEFQAVLQAVLERGGHVSTKRNADGTDSPYELNITYFDALAKPGPRVAKVDIDRFLCSQIVALSLKGMPAIYFHSLTGTRNDYAGVERFGYPRAINRRKWDEPELRKALDNRSTVTSRVFQRYVDLLRTRALHPAFHPDGTQTVLQLGAEVFGVERVAPDHSETIIALHSMSGETVEVKRQSLPRLADGSWHDLIADKALKGNGDAVTLKPYQCVWLRQQEA
jgi:sucrose phosphorylase